MICLLLVTLALGVPTPMYIQNFEDGLKRQEAGQYEQAIELYRKSLEGFEDFGPAWAGIGYCHQKIAEAYLKQADQCYTEAMVRHPESPRALEYQGLYYILIGDLEKADKNYQTLMQIDPHAADRLKKNIASNR
jgi:tetratricopeptide (TPR) repeat protein